MVSDPSRSGWPCGIWLKGQKGAKMGVLYDLEADHHLPRPLFDYNFEWLHSRLHCGHFDVWNIKIGPLGAQGQIWQVMTNLVRQHSIEWTGTMTNQVRQHSSEGGWWFGAKFWVIRPNTKICKPTFDSPGSASLICHSTNALRHIEKHSLFCSTYNSSKFCVMTPYYFGLKLIYRSFCISWCSFYQHSDNITAFRMGWSWHVVCTIFHRKI